MRLEDLIFQVCLPGEDEAVPCDLDCLAMVLGRCETYRGLIIQAQDGTTTHLEFHEGEDLATVLDQSDQCLAIEDLAFDSEAEEALARSAVKLLRALV